MDLAMFKSKLKFLYVISRYSYGDCLAEKTALMTVCETTSQNNSRFGPHLPKKGAILRDIFKDRVKFVKQ